jgi:putative ABC transport system permease protein
MDTLGLILADARYALRQLRLSPGFSLIAILTLALGIGANTAMFSVVDAVLIRPLPYADAERLVMVWENASQIGFPQNTPSPWNWQSWKRENTVLADIAATRGAGYLLSGEGEPEQLPSRRVTANFWTVLGARPLLGRVFTAAEDSGNERVVVISYGLWQRRFGASPDVLNRKILLNDEAFRIIGVMPREFYFLPSRLVEVWTPTAFTPQELNNAGSHYLNCVARLKPGVTLEQARTAMAALGRQLEEKSPNRPNHAQSVPALVPLREQLAGKTGASLVVLMAASTCVLLIACANLANLLLARGAAREREAAVRSALGADRSRLLAQFLTESLVLAGLGAAAGLALARPAMIFLESLVPMTMLAVKLSLDWGVLAFSAAVALVSGLIFGMLPAIGGSRVALQQTLREGGRGVSGPRRHWFQHSLIVSQTAMAVLLLTCGGFLLQTLRSLRQVELGMRTDKLLTLVTPLTRYRDFNKRVAFVNAMLENVRAIPGVVSAGSISVIPMTETGNTNSYILAGQNPAETNGQDALFRVVTRDYFPTIGASLREGRFFQDSDRGGQEPVAIVNETFAARHFPGRSALGARFQINTSPGSHWYTIAGVVREIRDRGVSVDLKQAMYLVNEQADQAWPQPSGMVIRTSVPPFSIVPAVREAIQSVDRNEPIARVQTLENIVDTQLSGPTQDSTLLAAFAGLALSLACVGLYGVLSYAVAQRTNEIGVRMAFGATSRDILLSFGRQGLTLTVAGLALGLALSVAASRLMSSLLYGFRPQYAPAVAAVSALLLAVAMLACLFPALRASRIDPIVALRYE